MQWYLKTGFAGQIFDRAKQRIRSANVQPLLAIILDRCILAKCVLLILENKCNTCWNEYVSLAEAAIFEYAFRLGARLIIEVQKDSEN